MSENGTTRRYRVAGIATAATVAAVAAAVALWLVPRAIGANVNPRGDSPQPAVATPVDASPDKGSQAEERPSHEDVAGKCLARIGDAARTGMPDSYAYPFVDVNAYHPLVPAYETAVAGMQVIVLVPEQPAEGRSLMFVHGGAYVAQLQEEHMWLASSIARATGAVVYIPVYPLASATTSYTDTYPPMVELYRRLVADGGEKGLTLFGDSAGAGLATGICEHGAEERLPQPERLILLSPWANVTEQPWMGLDVAANAWSGQTGGGGQRQWQVSPVYGNVSVLDKVTILNGELDGLASSIQAFYHQLRGNNVDCTLVSEPGEIHDYAYMVGRSASQRAFNLICSIVSGEAAGADGEWSETLSRDVREATPQEGIGDAEVVGDASRTPSRQATALSTGTPLSTTSDASTGIAGKAAEGDASEAMPREFSAWPGFSPRLPESR